MNELITISYRFAAMSVYHRNSIGSLGLNGFWSSPPLPKITSDMVLVSIIRHRNFFSRPDLIQRSSVHTGNKMRMTAVLRSGFAALYTKMSIGDVFGRYRLVPFDSLPLFLHFKIAEYRH